MDEEIAEGLHLGTMLMVAAAVGIFLVTISSIVRLGYIYRNGDTNYSTLVTDRLIWTELRLEADYQYGVANKRHVTDTDTLLKFLSNHTEDLSFAVFIRNETNTVWNCFTNIELTATEKTNLVKLPNIATCNWQYLNNETLTSTDVMVDTVYRINSARAAYGLEVKDYVRVFGYGNKSQIAKGIEPIHWFESDYTPAKNGFYVFIIY